jgi:hypothetical protein
LEHQFLQADGSHSTGCFDLTCPGFIQTSNEIALGAAIYPISIPGGLPYQITISIYKVRHIYMMYNHVFKSHTPKVKKFLLCQSIITVRSLKTFYSLL